MLCFVNVLTSSTVEYTQLFNAWNSIYWKLFQVCDINCLNDISRASGYIPISFEIDIRKFSFLHKLQFSDDVVLKDLYNIFGKK